MNLEQQRDLHVSVTAIKGFVSTLLIDDDFAPGERKEIYEIVDRECDRLKHLMHEFRRGRESSEEAEETDFIDLKRKLLADLEEAARTKLADAAAQLEKLAGMTEEQAREQLFLRAEQSTKAELSRRLQTLRDEAEADAERQAKQVILNSIQRLSTDYSIEATTAVVQLPSEDMKGKLIGREGRNIRTFEQVAGVDLIIDENPETVVISAFDPVRREIARITLMNLMLDGRIHPARIEELHEKAKQEIEKVIAESGDDAAARAKVSGISLSVLQTLGRLRFRSSYAQNVLDHSVEVAELCALFAEELGLNVDVARRAGLLHDIGKALSSEWEGPHAIAGMNFLKDKGEMDAVTHAVGAHHFEIEPASAEAQIVIVADAISASRPGARRENLDQYVKRVAKLEAIANSFPGVERSYAVQAGREVRLVVKPQAVSDKDAEQLAAEVAKRIESELQYPGQIKVTVIREFRAQSTAK